MVISYERSNDPDGRKKLIIVWSVLLIVAVTITWYYMHRGSENLAEFTEEQLYIEPENNVESITNPDLVRVTSGDNQYHEPDCDWVGSISSRMSRRKAVEGGYDPCPYCIEEDE